MQSENDLWMIHYKDDTTFNERLVEATNLINHTAGVEFAKNIYDDFKIPCGIKGELVEDKTREVESYYKFQIISVKKKL